MVSRMKGHTSVVAGALLVATSSRIEIEIETIRDTSMHTIDKVISTLNCALHVHCSKLREVAN